MCSLPISAFLNVYSTRGLHIPTYTCFFPQTPNISLPLTHTHTPCHTNISPLAVFPAQPARLRPRSNRHTVSHSFAQIHNHSLTYFHIRGSLLIPPRVQIHTQSPSFPALVQSASICNHIHHDCPRKMPQSGTP